MRRRMYRSIGRLLDCEGTTLVKKIPELAVLLHIHYKLYEGVCAKSRSKTY
jgi:hypothetical protein